MNDVWTETVDGPVHPYPAPVSLPEGHVINDRYVVERVLGYGGSAVVYAVFDRELKRRVALKLLRPDRISPTAIRRLRREVAIAREAASPRLLRVFDIGEAAEGPYLTMEHVDAPTLRALLEEGPLSIGEVVFLATGIAEALADLHALGIVHRDVKPSNLLVDGESVKLADFGLAFHLDGDESRLTQTAAVVGTLEYVSPEQVLGRDVDFRSDLYSFGIVLFEMLAGRPPFDTSSNLATLVAHLQRNVPDVRSFRSGVPSWLAHVVIGLLQKDPRARFQNALEVVAALRQQRVPWRRRLKPFRVIAAAVAAAAITAGGLLYVDSRRFAAVAHDEASTLSALNRYGQPLWSLNDTGDGRFAVVRQDGRPAWIAVVRGIALSENAAATADLLLLDPDTGRVERRLTLPSAAVLFPRFSKTYHATQIVSEDLRGDGNETVVVTFAHTPFWPAWAVTYDPRSNVARLLFISSGHVRLAAPADVNGDGVKDLIFFGLNNRMGWYSVMAAIDGQAREGTTSPDSVLGFPDRALLWYTLVARQRIERVRAPSAGDGSFSLDLLNHQALRVGRDGFIEPSTSPSDSAARMRSRREAYANLRESVRLSAGGFSRDAIAAAETGILRAMETRDANLLEWAKRVRAAAFVRGGEFERGEKEYADLVAASPARSEIAFDAAREFHLQGQLERAVRWYRDGLGAGSTVGGGRGRYEYLEGIILALAERQRWGDALQAVSAYTNQFQEHDDISNAIRQFIRWRQGLRMERVNVQRGSSPDEFWYWELERRFQASSEADALLREIELARKAASVAAVPMLLSLEADVHFRAGDRERARTLIRQARQEALAMRTSEVIVRAHMPVIEERFGRIAGN